MYLTKHLNGSLFTQHSHSSPSAPHPFKASLTQAQKEKMTCYAPAWQEFVCDKHVHTQDFVQSLKIQSWPDFSWQISRKCCFYLCLVCFSLFLVFSPKFMQLIFLILEIKAFEMVSGVDELEVSPDFLMFVEINLFYVTSAGFHMLYV